MTDVTAEGSEATPERTQGWRLRPRARNRWLVVHVLAAGTWIGIDVVMAVLVFTAVLTDDDGTKALAYQALDLFVVWTLLAAGLLSLATGVVLGLGTRYGLVRYWWVATKLALNLLLAMLVLVALGPEVSDAAERGDRFTAGESASLDVGDLIFPPIVSPLALLAAILLGVFKPWGRIRNGQRR
ncbi:MAG: hypothetical protein ACRD2C_21675 [Acidimicrobiales bacterium]